MVIGCNRDVVERNILMHDCVIDKLLYFKTNVQTILVYVMN